MTDDPFATAFEVLESIVAGPALPVGAGGKLYAAHDALAMRGEHERAVACGKASVALLRLEAALRRGDEAAVAVHRQSLGDLLAEWREACPAPEREHPLSAAA